MKNGNTMKKLVKVLAVLAGISIVVCFISVMMYFHKGEDSVTELLDLGQTYLEDGKYEQAVASLEAILKVDPKEARTEEERKILEDKDAILEQLADVYLAWADDEIAKENYDRTWEILEEGQEKTGDERFESKLNEVYALQNPIDETEEDGINNSLINSAVVSDIEGLWGTGNSMPTLKVFNGTKIDTYEVIEGDSFDTYVYAYTGTTTITATEDWADASGSYMKILLDDNYYYYYYQEEPDYLECRWDPDGYSGSDSLERLNGETLNDYNIRN